MGWFRRLRGTLRSEIDRDLDEEIRFHIEARVDEYVRDGMTAADARREALRRFGNPTLMREHARDADTLRWLHEAAGDARYAVRMARRHPGFSLLAIATLALGIGANTAIFSTVHAVLVRPLPYDRPEQLVAVWASYETDKTAKLLASFQDFERWHDHARSFDALAAMTWVVPDAVLTGRGTPRDVLAVPASVDFFSLLGVKPAFGRTFTSADVSRACTVVLTHRFWQSDLGGDANIVGRDLRLNDQACTVVGVMPSGFSFFPDATDLWTLITPPAPSRSGEMALRTPGAGVGVFGRLKPGTTRDAALAELRSIFREVDGGRRGGADMTAVVYPLQEEFTWLTGRNLRISLIVLFAAVGCVLLIACVNVANLLLGRSLIRQREMVIRSAIGSGRSRLFRQLLTESLCLSVMAAALGTVLAIAIVEYFRNTNPVELPPGTSVSVNVPVLVFTASLAAITALVFGLVPAWKGSRVDLNDALKAGGRAGYGSGRHRLARALIGVEVVLSLVLLAGAGLLIQSIARFGDAPLGFDAAGLIMHSVGLPKRYADPEQRATFYRRVLDDLGTRSELEGVALSTGVPLRGGPLNMLLIAGRTTPPEQTAVHDVGLQGVSEHYFRLLGIPLRQGRQFSGADTTHTTPVCIVNEALVQRYFGRENPIGKQVRFLLPPDAVNPWMTIVGVVSDERRSNPYDEMGWIEVPILYRPIEQRPAPAATLFFRAKTTAVAAAGKTVQSRLEKLDGDIRVGSPQPVTELVATFFEYPRFRAMLLGAFAMLALVLAIVGLYGVLAQTVSQRRQEIGVRMALGAGRRDVTAAILKEGIALATSGIAVGLLLAHALARFIGSLLYGIAPGDPATLAAVSAILLVAATCASYVPARRAAGVDPTIALRYE